MINEDLELENAALAEHLMCAEKDLRWYRCNYQKLHKENEELKKMVEHYATMCDQVCGEMHRIKGD